MSTLQAELAQVAELVWESVLGVSLVRRTQPLPALDPVVSACVRISGAWEGAVTIECTADFARTAAATMFGVEPPAVTSADSRDAIGELANMTGGNIKALLPEPCRLSLPSVADGGALAVRPQHAVLLTTVLFECDGSPLTVRLHRASGT
jgi:chemotaxis protein CheX